MFSTVEQRKFVTKKIYKKLFVFALFPKNINYYIQLMNHITK